MLTVTSRRLPVTSYLFPVTGLYMQHAGNQANAPNFEVLVTGNLKLVPGWYAYLYKHLLRR
jgi:hypothetical protein